MYSFCKKKIQAEAMRHSHYHAHIHSVEKNGLIIIAIFISGQVLGGRWKRCERIIGMAIKFSHFFLQRIEICAAAVTCIMQLLNLKKFVNFQLNVFTKFKFKFKEYKNNNKINLKFQVITLFRSSIST